MPPEIVEPKEIESTLAKERMVAIIHANTQVAADAQKILDLLNADPSLDGIFCRMFGIKPLNTGGAATPR